MVATWISVSVAVGTFSFLSLGSWWVMKRMSKPNFVSPMHRKILQMCLRNKTKGQMLLLAGEDQLEQKFVGHIEGIAEDPSNQMVFITFKEEKGFKGMTSQPKVFAGYTKDIKNGREGLKGKKVFLKGITFSHELDGFFYLAKYFKYDDMQLKVRGKVFKFGLQDQQKEQRVITRNALDSSPHHQKDIETGNTTRISSTIPSGESNE